MDVFLVDRGLFPTRAKAQAAVMAGKVKVKGVPNPKAGSPVAPDAQVEILADAVPFVSRGGLKLQAALKAFALDVSGRTALDIGASTGGFTDCLLKRGARKVHAVDVGTAQLDAALRADPRVVSHEKTHARDMTRELFGEDAGSLDLAVIDVSFISLTAVLPHVLRRLKAPFDIVALIKPQFELEPKKVPKGVVRNLAYRDEAVAKVRKAAAGLGLSEAGLIESPAKGPKGNVEFLIHLK